MVKQQIVGSPLQNLRNSPANIKGQSVSVYINSNQPHLSLATCTSRRDMTLKSDLRVHDQYNTKLSNNFHQAMAFEYISLSMQKGYSTTSRTFMRWTHQESTQPKSKE